MLEALTVLVGGYLDTETQTTGYPIMMRLGHPEYMIQLHVRCWSEWDH